MSSLWGSKKDGNDETHQNGDQEEAESSRPATGRQPDRRDPDERTRLLPPRNDGYLDPDDPAVCILRFEGFLTANRQLIGISLQLMECQSSSLFLNPPPRHQLPVVGGSTRLNFREPSWIKYSWIWLLRLLIHYRHRSEPTHRNPLLLHTFQSHGDR